MSTLRRFHSVNLSANLTITHQFSKLIFSRHIFPLLNDLSRKWWFFPNIHHHSPFIAWTFEKLCHLIVLAWSRIAYASTHILYKMKSVCNLCYHQSGRSYRMVVVNGVDLSRPDNIGWPFVRKPENPKECAYIPWTTEKLHACKDRGYEALPPHRNQRDTPNWLKWKSGVQPCFLFTLTLAYPYHFS